MAEQPLIGEEMFVAGAYLGDNATQRGSVVALDTMRWILIIGIVLATALLLEQPVRDAINRIIGGG
jgi:ABC-type sulfate transport system permease subunit